MAIDIDYKKFRKITKIVKTVLYLIYFLYIITSIYLAVNFNSLIPEVGIFTFFIFLKNWGIGGIFLLSITLIIENIHIYMLKKRIRELEN